MSTTDEQAPAALGTGPSRPDIPKIKFGAPDRTAGLPSLGGPPARAVPPPAAPAPAPVPVVAAEAAPAATRAPRRTAEPGAPAKRARATPRRRAGAINPDQVGVYLPPATLTRLRTHHRQLRLAGDESVTFTSICLDAIEACQDRLADLFGPPRPPRTGPLFAGRVPRRVRHDGDPAQVTLTISAGDREIIDDLVDRYGCGSRSALFVKTLDVYLEGVSGAG